MPTNAKLPLLELFNIPQQSIGKLKDRGLQLSTNQSLHIPVGSYTKTARSFYRPRLRVRAGKEKKKKRISPKHYTEKVLVSRSKNA